MPEGKEFDRCGVCGRTILSGERAAEYATPDGARAGVCALCKPAAESAGWIPAELAGTLERGAGGRRRGLGLRERLSRASDAARALTTRPARPRERSANQQRPAPKQERTAPNQQRPAAEQQRPAAKQQRPAPKEQRPGRDRERTAQEKRVERSQRTPRGAGAKRARRAEGGPRDQRERNGPRSRSTGRSPSPRARSPERSPPAATPERLLRRGVERFNASGGPRKVAGLTRALGEPHVAVRASSGGAVVVTVAWELSWYQWEVGADENGDAVREAGKGNEVSELALRDRSWNASVAGDGKVRLGLAAARQASGERE